MLIQEVEEQQDWHKEGQGKGGGDPDQDDGGCQLQTTPQEECCKVCQVLVHIGGVLSQPVDDSARGRHMEEGERCPASAPTK